LCTHFIFRSQFNFSVPANQNSKPKANKSRHFMKKLQKMEDDQFYRELPIWMQSMI